MLLDEFDIPPVDPQDPQDPQDPLEPQDPVDPQDPQDPPTDDEDFTSQYTLLKTLGIVDEVEEFDGKAETLKEILESSKEKSKKQLLNELLESFPDSFRPIMEYVANGGESIEEFLNYYSSVDIRNVSLEDPLNQKRILESYYKAASNFDDDKIKRIISKIPQEELKSAAEEALEDLLEIEEANKQKALEAQKEQKRLQEEQKKQFTSSIANSIEELQTPPARKAQLKSMMMAPLKHNDQVTTKFSIVLSKVYSNPKHLTQLADILLDYDEDKGLPLDRLARKKVTSDIDEFRRQLKEAEKVKPTSVTKSPVSNFNWDGFLQNS